MSWTFKILFNMLMEPKRRRFNEVRHGHTHTHMCTHTLTQSMNPDEFDAFGACMAGLMKLGVTKAVRQTHRDTGTRA